MPIQKAIVKAQIKFESREQQQGNVWFMVDIMACVEALLHWHVLRANEISLCKLK